jgi:23S rRNA U2552 (ribose-2'-O)-methylase RlmE/FtsJ
MKYQLLKKIKSKLSFFLFYKKNTVLNELQIAHRQKMEHDIIKKIFKNDLTVRSGLFSGMKYINTSFGSSLLPKILGSYEYPIQKWIKDAINKDYSEIIDIGSAEGYYSVGLAYTTNNSKIYAYDINEKALDANKKMAALNNVEKKITFKNVCSNEDLNNLVKNNTLIICDIEGAEKVLLDPIKAPNLLLCDYLIESHDFLDSEITETLIDRFHKTHKIEIIVDSRRDTDEALKYTQDLKIANLLIDELRPEKMKWLRITKMN